VVRPHAPARDPGRAGIRRRPPLQGHDGAGHSYLAIYEIDAGDLTDPVRELRARSASGQMHMSDALQLDPLPAVTLYELLG
jgi:hypothetical protein